MIPENQVPQYSNQTHSSHTHRLVPVMNHTVIGNLLTQCILSNHGDYRLENQCGRRLWLVNNKADGNLGLKLSMAKITFIKISYSIT
jgi:hypothetical protein